MKICLIFSFFVLYSFAEPRPESFVIQIYDRSMTILSPQNKRSIFSVLVENRSLSDQVGKFTVQGKLLKYVSVKSGQTEPVEIENKTSDSNILISAHGNSIRALCKYLFKLDENQISKLEIPTGNPLLINLDKERKITECKYLDSERAKDLVVF